MSKRIFLTMIAALCIAAPAWAQVVVRVPFVRVETGGPGTYVRAPFVNLFIPSGPPVYYGPPPGVYLGPPPPFVAASPPGTLPQPRVAPQQLPAGPAEVKPVNPKIIPDPPAPAQPLKAPTIDEFVKAFKPKAGNYEITLMNPVNKNAETVRFSLPGEPQRVRATANTIEFEFGPRRFVRIEFDQDGPLVISR
jgi:hypothetical protein